MYNKASKTGFQCSTKVRPQKHSLFEESIIVHEQGYCLTCQNILKDIVTELLQALHTGLLASVHVCIQSRKMSPTNYTIIPINAHTILLLLAFH